MGGIPITLTPAGGAPATVSSAGIAVTLVDAATNARVPLPINGSTVAVRNSSGADSHNGTAVVTTQGALTGINLASSVVMVDNNDSVPVGDATAVAAGQDNGTAAVAAAALTRVTLPGTDKIIKSTVKYTAPAVTGTYVNGYTFTIVAGVITAIVAS